MILQDNFISSCSPECIPYPILEVDVEIIIYHHQITCVKVHITMATYIADDLFVVDLLAGDIPVQWRQTVYTYGQEPRYTCYVCDR